MNATCHVASPANLVTLKKSSPHELLFSLAQTPQVAQLPLETTTFECLRIIQIRPTPLTAADLAASRIFPLFSNHSCLGATFRTFAQSFCTNFYIPAQYFMLPAQYFVLIRTLISPPNSVSYCNSTLQAPRSLIKNQISTIIHFLNERVRTENFRMVPMEGIEPTRPRGH